MTLAQYRNISMEVYKKYSYSEAALCAEMLVLYCAGKYEFYRWNL